MKTLLSAFLSSCIFILSAQSPPLDWLKGVGGSVTYSNAICSDGGGNSYTVGRFHGSNDFDPGPGTQILTATGTSAPEAFIVKLNSSGNLVWAKQIGGPQDDEAYNCCTDATGNLYVSGMFSGTVDFDPGPGVTNLTPAGTSGAFLAKFNAMGTLLWARSVGGSYYNNPYGLCTDNFGNVFFGGEFYGSGDFDPGSGTTTLSSPSNISAFVVKLDGAGNFKWAKQFGGSGTERIYAMTGDASGDVFLGGSFDGTGDFDPGSSVFNLTPVANYDAFIVRLDSLGNFVWAKQIGGTGSESANGLQTDHMGNILIAGGFVAATDFDPGPGVFTISANYNSAFVCKLNGAGNFIWAKAFISAFTANGKSIAVDQMGNIFLASSFVYSVDMDPGPGVYTLHNNTQACGYITELDSNGIFKWAYQTDSSSFSSCAAICVDSIGGVLVCGIYTGTTNFYIGTGNPNLTAVGSTDAFILRLGMPAGLPKHEMNETIRVHPNPFSFQTNFILEHEEDYQLIICDVNGKLCDNRKFSVKHFIYENPSPPPGIYFYKISTSEKVISTGKLIISE